MTFSMLDHTDQLEFLRETNTQLTCACPSCGAKLQVSKRKGAYFCVAGCAAQDVREAMDLPFSNYTEYRNRTFIPPQSIPLPRRINLHRCNVDYTLETSTFFHRKQNEHATKTIYQYSPKHRVVRVDFAESKEKVFYFTVLKDDRWSVEFVDDFPLLHQNLITEKNKFITLVEGEKCAVELVRHGLVAVTPAPFAWSEERLQKHFNSIFYDVEGILCIPDNDEIGLKKAVRVQSAAWRVGLPCRILNLEEYYVQTGDDVVDLIDRGIDIVQLIESLL
jgi:hypothetical protein